jgi:hypothetical protein
VGASSWSSWPRPEARCTSGQDLGPQAASQPAQAEPACQGRAADVDRNHTERLALTRELHVADACYAPSFDVHHLMVEHVAG